MTATLGAALVVAVAGCGRTSGPVDPHVVIGSKGFTESRLVAAAYAQALSRVGFTPTIRTVPTTPALARALRAGQVDLYPEYTGTAWTLVEGSSPLALAGQTRARQEQLVRDRLATDSALHAFSPAPGSNNAVAACTRASGLTSLTQFAGRTTPVSIAGQAEIFSRRDALPLLQTAYGFTIGRRVVTTPGDRYGPISRGHVECMAAYETDPEIESMHLTILADPMHVTGGAVDYRPMALASAGWWNGLSGDVQDQVETALGNVSHKMTTAWLRSANLRVTSGHESPSDVALELVNVSVPGRAAAAP
ncbi:MAG: glycine betaine ABC transporter substrate-binding protein [Miltoncostaeaceae bacterium]